MNPGRSRLLTPKPYANTVHRAVRPAHLVTPLKYGHSRTVTTRFNPATPAAPGFAVLYFSEHPRTTLYEVNVLLGSPHTATVPNPRAGAWTTIPVVVSLQGVVDLRQPGELALIETSVQELTGDWFCYPLRVPAAPVPTQQLGAALFAVPGVEGFLTYSAKAPTTTNLIVFPTKIQPGSTVTHTDPAGLVHVPIP